MSTALAFTACATIRPPQPPSLKLPQPPTDLRARRKGDKVILTWTIPALTTDRQAITPRGPTSICRGLAPALSQCGTAVATAAPVVNSAAATQPAKQKPSQTYSDTLPPAIETDDQSASVAYAIEVLNSEGHGAGLSNQVRVPLAHTLPVPADFMARLTSEGVVLSWTEAETRTPSPQINYAYRVYRRDDGGKASLVGELWDASSPKVSLTDATIEWERTYYYRVEAVTILVRETADDKTKDAKAKIEIEGDDSAEVEVFAHDTFPPAVPSGLQAVFSGPGQQTFIDLIWAPVADMDLAGYNIYRHEDGTAAVKLNSDLAKTPAYRDTNVVAGKRYSYSVSAVDVRGNESARSDEAAESVP